MIEYTVHLQSSRAEYADGTRIHWNITDTQKEISRWGLLIPVRFFPDLNLMFKLPNVTKYVYATALW